MMKRIASFLLTLTALAIFAAPLRAASTTTAVDVMVTPIVTVSLTVDTTFYNFSYIDINSSTNSATPVTLSNVGNVNVSMQKRGHNSANWTISADTIPALNEFVLWSATGTNRPNLSDYRTDIATPPDLVTSGLTDLTGTLSGNSVSVAPGDSVKLWFRLQMPTATYTGAQQNIPINFVGTAQ